MKQLKFNENKLIAAIAVIATAVVLVVLALNKAEAATPSDGWITKIQGMFETTINPINEYAVGVKGFNLRIYEWIPESDKSSICQAVFSDAGMNTQCWKK